MIVSICIGRGGSQGVKRKNTRIIGKKEIMAYPILASTLCKSVDATFFSSEDAELKNIAKYYGANIIDRPKELATNEALGEDVFVHAYKEVKLRIATMVQPDIEFVVMLFANAPCVTSMMLQEMIERLRKTSVADSICTISKADAYTPYRAKRIVVHTDRVVPFCVGIIDDRVTCDRSSGTEAWFPDYSAAVVKPYCLDDLSYGFQPHRWLGRYAIGYRQKYKACDVDHEWQFQQCREWMRNMGVIF